MNGKPDTQFFSVTDGSLFYLETPIEQTPLMQETQELLNKLQISEDNIHRLNRNLFNPNLFNIIYEKNKRTERKRHNTRKKR